MSNQKSPYKEIGTSMIKILGWDKTDREVRRKKVDRTKKKAIYSA